MMPARSSANFKNTAEASHTATAAETSLTTVTATFPGNSVAHPTKVRVSGSVSGYIQIQVGTNKYLNVACNPNAPYVEEAITGVDGDVTGLPVGFQADAAGTIRVIIYGQ